MPNDKFLNADDTVDLIKTGISALDDKVDWNSYQNFYKDKKARLWIITDSNNQTVSITLNGSETLTSIDWGDGTVDTNTTHTYTNAGKYVIVMSCTGIKQFNNSSSTVACISPATVLRHLQFGIDLYEREGFGLERYAFYNCRNLISVKHFIHYGGADRIPLNAYSNCWNLQSYEYFSDRNSGNYIIPDGTVFENVSNKFKLVNCSIIGSRNGKGLFPSFSTMDGAYSTYDRYIGSMIINDIIDIQKDDYSSISDDIYLNFDDRAIYYYPIKAINLQKTSGIMNLRGYSNIPNDFLIYVPENLYDTYIADTNWSAIASHIRKGLFTNEYQELDNKLSTTGGALTGDVTTTNTTFTSTSLVTKQYVDDTIAALNGNNIQY